MFESLISILEQIVAAVGTAAVLVLAAAAKELLSRARGKITSKTSRYLRFAIDLGMAGIAIEIRIGRAAMSRKALTGAEDDEEGS